MHVARLVVFAVNTTQCNRWVTLQAQRNYYTTCKGFVSQAGLDGPMGEVAGIPSHNILAGGPSYAYHKLYIYQLGVPKHEPPTCLNYDLVVRLRFRLGLVMTVHVI